MVGLRRVSSAGVPEAVRFSLGRPTSVYADESIGGDLIRYTYESSPSCFRGDLDGDIAPEPGTKGVLSLGVNA